MSHIDPNVQRLKEIRAMRDRASASVFNPIIKAVKAISGSGFAGARGQNVVIDGTGVHTRSRAVPGNFHSWWGMIITYNKESGIAQVQKCVGELPYLTIENFESPLIDVFVGEDGPFRPQEPGAAADFLYCLPNPPDVTPDWYGIAYFRTGSYDAPPPSELSDVQFAPQGI